MTTRASLFLTVVLHQIDREMEANISNVGENWRETERERERKRETKTEGERYEFKAFKKALLALLIK
jgi:hypothetical protein